MHGHGMLPVGHACATYACGGRCEMSIGLMLLACMITQLKSFYITSAANPPTSGVATRFARSTSMPELLPPLFRVMSSS